MSIGLDDAYHVDLDDGALIPSLEEYSLARFDDLVSKGEIIYEASVGQVVEDKGFHFEFRVVPHLKLKPASAPDAPERKTGQGGFNPFLNPEAKYVLSRAGDNHLLLLNKFCVCRPMLLLITRLFEPQSNALNASDLAATWKVMETLGKRYCAIYNCGYDAGSSQGHKHVQIFPRPQKEDLKFELFPSHATSSTKISSNLPNVPYQHFVLALPASPSWTDVVAAHDKLLERMRKAQKLAGSVLDHNVILTHDWICLIPRAHNGHDKGAAANAFGILGLVWVTSEEEKKLWEDLGPVNHLQYLCI